MNNNAAITGPGEGREGDEEVGGFPTAICNVLPLPTGYWEEITDYLMCYDGDPTVTFSAVATVATRGLALEDDNVLVLHREDLGNNICVLAIDGYGEEGAEIPSDELFVPRELSSGIHDNENRAMTDFGDDGVQENMSSGKEEKFTKEDWGRQGEKKQQRPQEGVLYRGGRQWKDKATSAGASAATVCCAHCCSTLGFAAIEAADTFRLFKHRLSAGGTVLLSDGRLSPQSYICDNRTNAFRLNTISTFMAREMVRYAESEAVFSFVVIRRSDDSVDGVGGIGGMKHRQGSYIVMKLLSWDSMFCTEADIGKGDSSNSSENVVPSFARAIKIVFEEMKGNPSHLGTEATNQTARMQWFWEDIDLCCPPATKGGIGEGGAQNEDHGSASRNKSATSQWGASVQIYLSADEYGELLQQLTESSLRTPSVVRDSAVRLKGLSINGGAHLSIVPA